MRARYPGHDDSAAHLAVRHNFHHTGPKALFRRIEKFEIEYALVLVVGASAAAYRQRRQGSGFTPAWRGAGTDIRLPADPVIAGEDCFRNSAVGARNQLGGPFRWEGFFFWPL